MGSYVFNIEGAASGITGSDLIDRLAAALDDSSIIHSAAVGLDTETERLSLVFEAEGEGSVDAAQRALGELARAIALATGAREAHVSGEIEFEDDADDVPATTAMDFERLEVLVS
jgi:hypothetical protein